MPKCMINHDRRQNSQMRTIMRDTIQNGPTPGLRDDMLHAPDHGGDIAMIQRAFPNAPHPWIDLSTGINPWSYPVRDIPPEAWHRLPSRAAEDVVREAAAAYYGAASADQVVLAPGSQALIQWLPRLRARSRVAVLSPTYGEHAWSWAAAGHDVLHPTTFSDVPDDITVLIVTRPNNPDGAIAPSDWLAGRAHRLARHGGWLVVDEAFADAIGLPSITQAIPAESLIALRSFGKFFGLAGCRLGAAIVVSASLRKLLRAALGPWCVAGPTLAIAEHAFADREWIMRTRERLARSAAQLDDLAARCGYGLIGGTPLFRLYEHPDAQAQYAALCASGIVVRRFGAQPTWLRFGLPPGAMAEARLARVLGQSAPS